jgi:hypothetical protein
MMNQFQDIFFPTRNLELNRQSLFFFSEACSYASTNPVIAPFIHSHPLRFGLIPTGQPKIAGSYEFKNTFNLCEAMHLLVI